MALWELPCLMYDPNQHPKEPNGVSLASRRYDDDSTTASQSTGTWYLNSGSKDPSTFKLSFSFTRYFRNRDNIIIMLCPNQHPKAKRTFWLDTSRNSQDATVVTQVDSIPGLLHPFDASKNSKTATFLLSHSTSETPKLRGSLFRVLWSWCTNKTDDMQIVRNNVC